MAESQFPLEPGQLEALLSEPAERCPEPMITNFEELDVLPLFAEILRRLQYGTWRIEFTHTWTPEQSVTSRLAQCFLHIPLPTEEEVGARKRSITDGLRWAALLAIFLPFVRDYPNPKVWIGTICYNLRAALISAIKVTPMTHALFPCLFAAGAVVARGAERMVSQISLAATFLLNYNDTVTALEAF